MSVVSCHPELISLREYAKRRGVSLQAVQRAIASKRISVVTGEDGKPKIDPIVANAEWEKNTKKEHRPHNLARKLQKEVSDARLEKSGVKLPKENLAQDEPMSYNDSRTVREAYAARLVKLEYEMKVGTIVSSDDVKQEYFQILRITRDSILNIPDRISSILAAEADPATVHLILTQELHQALEELSREPTRSGKVI
jgi:hypothetical protein